MQRSRRALLQRRALEKAVMSGGWRSRFCLYKVSVSLVLVSWGILFLCTLWISSRGSPEPPVGISNGDQRKPGLDRRGDNSVEKSLLGDACAASCENSRVKEESSVMVVDRNGNGAFSHHQPGGSAVKSENGVDGLSRSVPVGLEEFKIRAFSSKSKSVPGQAGGVVHRVEPGGREYNYASSAKGAKVLAFNKEAKGAANILSRDKDKYLRNPCSVEGKFVVIELSEETLVDTIEIANFEHYACNLKEFELLGTLVYPTDEWLKLGNFTAPNVKLAQRFALQDPKWVRYLKLNLLSHYGSEFYCTLSVIEVYGVDAVEWMLEDLISAQDNLFVTQESSSNQKSSSSQTEPSQGDDLYQSNEETQSDHSLENPKLKRESMTAKVPDHVEEFRHQVGRMPGDTALKILMQKVRSLDLSISVVERYLEEVNSRYGIIFKEFDNDLGEKHALIEKIRSDLHGLLDSRGVIAKDLSDLASWKSLASRQLDGLFRDYSDLRSSVQKVQQIQMSMENKSIVVFFTCLVFGILAFVRLFTDMLLSVFVSFGNKKTTKESRKFCCMSSSWFFLVLSCSIILLMLAL